MFKANFGLLHGGHKQRETSTNTKKMRASEGMQQQQQQQQKMASSCNGTSEQRREDKEGTACAYVLQGNPWVFLYLLPVPSPETHTDTSMGNLTS